ncbi:MAG: hypothetical protein NZP34_10695, partial [Caldilineales bacterium]|nr:hypothetical protein [Caldilineales bacterium]
AFAFPRAWLPDTYDFSFSGLKTAVLRAVQQLERDETAGGRKLVPGSPLPPNVVADLAASFQQAVVDVLVGKTLRAAADVGATEICLCGGVAANRALREALRRASPLPVSIPPLSLCTDNAAMIAAAGYFRGYRLPDGFIGDTLDLDVVAHLPLVSAEGGRS